MKTIDQLSKLEKQLLLILETVDEIMAILQPNALVLRQPESGTVWTHRNGNTYEVVCVTNVTEGDDIRYPLTVVYRGENGKMWSPVAADWQRSMTRLK